MEISFTYADDNSRPSLHSIIIIDGQLFQVNGFAGDYITAEEIDFTDENYAMVNADFDYCNIIEYAE